MTEVSATHLREKGANILSVKRVITNKENDDDFNINNCQENMKAQIH